jgi:hypothetical protein
MPASELRLIKRWQPPEPKAAVPRIPRGTRGIYVLYKKNRRTGALNVVYVGMAGVGGHGGIQRRLKKHLKKKAGLWTHFSVFEVWENITHSEVAELEGLFREIYRHDARANRLNKQKSFKKLRMVPAVIRTTRA